MSESQKQLEAAKTETQKQSKELALVRGNPRSCPAGTSLLGFADPAVGLASSLRVWEGGHGQCMGKPGPAGHQPDPAFRGDV